MSVEDKFLQKVSRSLLQRFGNDLKNVAVVFNNKRPQLFMRKYLAEIAGKAIWSPAFFTIQPFIAQSSTKISASPAKQFVILFGIYNQLLRSEGRETLSADAFYSLSEIILADFSQIDYYLVDADKIFSIMGNVTELLQQFQGFEEEQIQFLSSFWSSFSAEKQNQLQQRFVDLWQRMPRLYKQFHEKLNLQNFDTIAGTYRSLAEGKAENPDFIRKFKHTVFIGFNALSGSEERLFKKWQDEGLCSFYFDANEHYVTDPLHEAGFFIRRNIEIIGLKNALPFGKSGELNDPEKEIKVLETVGNVAQAKILANIIHPDNDNLNKAIVLANESLLVPVLQTLPLGIKTNVTMGYPFVQSSVFGFADLWLSIQEELELTKKSTVSYPKVISFLYHPLVGVDEKDIQIIHSSIIKEQLNEVECTSLWTLGTLAAQTFTAVSSDENLPEKLVLVLENILSGLRGDQALRDMDLKLISEALKNLRQLADSFLEIDQLKTFSLSLQSKLVRKGLQSLRITFEGEPLEGLQVMGLLESRCLDFDELIILGMNEGVLPRVSMSPTFIPDSIRKAFRLPVLENQNAISAYLFYRLIQSAKKITLIYNGVTDENSKGEPSRFIRQIEFETKCIFINQLQVNETPKIESECGITVEKDGPVWNKLQLYFSSNGQYPNPRLSATDFTDYIACPLRFFYKRIAGLKEPERLPDEIEAGLIGSILHQLMEGLYSEYIGKSVSSKQLEALKYNLPTKAVEALKAVMFGKNQNVKLKAVHKIVLKVVEQYARIILNHDSGIAPFTILELENKKDYLLHYQVKVGSGNQKIWLYGIIDRVDNRDGKTRIVDYKTGGDKIEYRSLEGLFDVANKHQNRAMLQTLYYTYVYEKVRNMSRVEPNLYIVKKFGHTQFKTDGAKGIILEQDELENMKGGFAKKLQGVINDIFDPEKDFYQTSNLKHCQYCAYKEVCRR
ncbi:MAG: PD-(D/E)XK nuclease family protein [Flavobacterium sp.]|nr:PD-(D/E)XK nuclease family protein [Pedobacter sp.]